MQPGFFDLDERYQKLDERDPLVQLDRLVDWEQFRDTLEKLREKPRKSQAGRKPFDVVTMFKVLVLQHLYNLSDDEAEFQIRDRYSFCRFLRVNPEDRVPDAKTIWLFREQLVNHELMDELFLDFQYQLNSQGFQARKGQIVDASFVDAPRQRNSREDNGHIKKGERPEHFDDNPNVGSQKDTEARWAKKHEETHFGYKNHVSVDNQFKLIREYAVTPANVHDSQMLSEVLDAGNSSKEVWADSAYYSQDTEIELKASGYRSRIHKKAQRNKPLSEREAEANRQKSKTRARVEHVFASITYQQGGSFTRVIGLARSAVKVGLMNLVYNMRRLLSLSRASVST